MKTKQILYNGSSMAVPVPRIASANRFLDFGPGFYTTTSEKQAGAFAGRVAARRGNGRATLNQYELVASAYDDCRVLSFDSPGQDWLEFVIANRSGGYEGPQYDLIIGPVADDDVYQTLDLYALGAYSRKQALAALKTRRLADQYVFSSERGLGYLHFLGAKEAD